MNTDRFKFRVWDERTKTFVQFRSCNDDEPFTYILGNPDGANHIQKGMGPIEQCTGLRDKGEKLIFEGDIVAGSNGSINGVEWPYKGVVKWIIQKAEFAVPSWAYDSDGNYHGDSTHYVEVVGNVHENQEMVK